MIKIDESKLGCFRLTLEQIYTMNFVKDLFYLMEFIPFHAQYVEEVQGYVYYGHSPSFACHDFKKDYENGIFYPPSYFVNIIRGPEDSILLIVKREDDPYENGKIQGS